ncbi:hypothetical protein KY290_010775 [Solanum tuberosum]|uniref:Uncharacterized protein n=1 Tax=Solanum tuberosum TaxID=4113 RepID=A0ABQ7W0R0_SOLTU|nr:hypothetical protein KY290_010775 [Solanum tuberosum]
MNPHPRGVGPSTGHGPLSWVDYFRAGSRAVLGSSSSPLNTPTQQPVRPFQQPPMRQPSIGHASTLCADTSKVKGRKKQQPTARASSTATAWAASTSTARPTSSPVGMSLASSVGRKRTRDVGFDVYTDIQSGRQVINEDQVKALSQVGKDAITGNQLQQLSKKKVQSKSKGKWVP